MSNYELMESFLEVIKEFALENPDKEITKNFIYSNLMEFNVKNNQGKCQYIKEIFESFKDRYKNIPNIDVFEVSDRPFLWFKNGKMSGNEIKLYIPLDKDHIDIGAKMIFDFIVNANIEHQSKIAEIIRNDNLVIRVNSLEDAYKIIEFVSNNNYVKQGMLKVNPFIPNINGIGIAMDNSYSYNSTLCSIIRDFINKLRMENRMDMFTLENLNVYIKKRMENEYDLDLKDIYSLLSKTTSKNFSIADFISHAQNKLIDKYTSDRERITDPRYYFEQAVISASKFRLYDGLMAIKSYLRGDSSFFPNNNNERIGLLKYVRPGDLIWLMRSELQKNNIRIPMTDDDLIKEYITLVVNRQNGLDDVNCFKIIKEAFLNTLRVYNMQQARVAFEMLISDGDIRCFTNRFKDREKLMSILPKIDVKKVILSNIDINGLDFNNIREITNRFVKTLNLDQKIDGNIVNENSTSTVNNQDALNDANYFEIIKQAFLNTLRVYNMQQARVALEMLISDNDLRYFTNRFKDREKLASILPKMNVKKVILSNIDITDLDFNNIREITNRFVKALDLDQINKVRTA